MNRLLRLFRRRPLPSFRVGDLAFYRGRAMAVSRLSGTAAELVWIGDDKQVRTAGFVPLRKLRRAA